jgi:phage recombination protein Bet
VNQIVQIRQGDLSPRQLDLIRRTVAKDCDTTEFDHFMAVASRLGLDPLRKQICAMVFNKNDAKKRNMSIITQIDGFRVIAARQGDYRPMETAPIIEYDEAAKDPATNPLGIVRAEVRVWKRHGSEWHQVAGEAYWDEFVPLEQEWAYDEIAGKRQPTGPRVLTEKSPWRRMGRVMIAKVAEAQALRRGWPDDLSGVYADEELHRAQVIDVASELVANYQETERLQRVGAKDTLLFLFDFESGNLEAVERGNIADRLTRFYEREAASAQQIIDFRQRNEASLKTFWAWAPGDALEVKKIAEGRVAALIEQQRHKE